MINFKMIQFHTRQILKHKALWFWPGLYLLFILAIVIWGSIQPAATGPFLIILGQFPIPVWAFMFQALAAIVIICVIAYPKHYADTLDPERASLIFSHEVSRTEFFFTDFASILWVSFLYTLFMVVVFAILAGIEAGIFPIQFYIASLILCPFFIVCYYISVVFFITLTKSRLAGALIGYFILGASTFLIHGNKTLTEFGYNSPILHGFVSVFSYIIPSARGIQELWTPVLQTGFGMFDWSLFGFIIASCIPFFVVSYLMVVRREF